VKHDEIRQLEECLIVVAQVNEAARIASIRARLRDQYDILAEMERVESGLKELRGLLIHLRWNHAPDSLKKVLARKEE
jgi:hypothetical protein